METNMMACLEALHSDVSKITSDNARKCLTDFIKICSVLYSAEAEDEQASQDIVRKCREKILKAHRKSVGILDALLVSGTANEHCNAHSVMDKIKELVDISESIDRDFGQVPPYVPDTERLARVLNNGSPHALDNSEDTKARVREIIGGLHGLADIDRALDKAEKEVWATNRKLSHRLESLKQEAGAHPAIEAYTARNCRSPLAAKTRHEEYVQYAAAMERVLRKIKKATETLRASSQSDLVGLEKQLPALRTLSQTLGRLHVTTLEASGSPQLRQGFPKTPGQAGDKPSLTQNSPLGASDTDREKLVTERLTQAVACVGSMRRLVDASLGQVTAMLSESAGDWGAHATAEGATNLITSPTGTGAVLSSLKWPSGGDDLLALSTFKFLPLGDKECREQLVGGTRLLSSAIEHLTRTLTAKSSVMETQAVLDSALCRPFPETSILRLELIRLLIPQEDLPVPSQPPEAAEGEKSPKPKRPRKAESPGGKKNLGTKPPVKKRSKNPKNQHNSPVKTEVNNLESCLKAEHLVVNRH